MSDSRTTRPEWSPGRLATYHILPGIVSLLVFIPVAWLIRGEAHSTAVALFIAVLMGEVPMSWYLMRRAVLAEGGSMSRNFLFPWMGNVKRGLLIGLGLPLILTSMVIVFGIASAAEPAIIDAFFSWVPQWMRMEASPERLLSGDRYGLIALWGLSAVVGWGIGGATQELYHRGFLLPRAAHLGWKAVPFNAGMFAVFHLAAPWGWPFFFLASLLWAAAVYRWKSVEIGLAAHIGMLFLGWVMLTLMVFGVLQPPG